MVLNCYNGIYKERAMRGNIFQSEIETVCGEIPEYLFAGRLVCRTYDSFGTVAEDIQNGRLNTESAILICTASADGKKEFLQQWEKSEYPQNCIVLVENAELGSNLPGLVFYPKSILPTDAFFYVRKGDILDYQIPNGKINIDLPGLEFEQRDPLQKPIYRKTSPFPGITVIQEKYTRFYCIKGAPLNHLMIDCGFGEGDLKSLRNGIAHGEWQLALTHGHRDHAGGCSQFRKLLGSKGDLENAGIFYAGQVVELEEGKTFQIGHRRIRVVDLSGHSVKDFGYYMEPEQILICGDAIATGPNYTMCKGGDVDRWIESLERLQQKMTAEEGALRIREIWCTHREGRLTFPAEAVHKMLLGLRQLRNGQGERYGATVYGFGAVHWMDCGGVSFFC